MRDAFGVFHFARSQMITSQDAFIFEHVEIALINQRRGHVRASALFSPYDILARCLPIAERDVATCASATDEDWRFRAATTRDHDQIIGEDRRRRGDLGAAAKPP